MYMEMCLSSGLLLPSSLLADLSPVLAQGGAFPRGPGFYFSLPKLIFLLLGFFLWLRLCWWVNRDTEQVELPRDTWNSYIFAAGVAGLALLWLSPWFWVTWIGSIVLVGLVGLVYVQQRNQRVEPAERVLNQYHLQDLLSRYLKLRFSGNSAAAAEAKEPIRFIGRSMGQREADPRRVSRVEGAKGYKAALHMVYEALKSRATDIHLEPSKEEMSVRFRVDGVMQHADPFSRVMGDAVVNIFKVLCNMDITEKRKPQDGSFSADVETRTVDFRVATAGSVMGEKLVMRVLDKSQQIVSLKKIGMREKMVEQIRQVVRQPHGLFLVCGPTGAGKSTTLYACLNEIDRFQQNIITIENPVEYHLANVTQIEVNVRAGKSFANELRSILRQDPDVIMIGEIRDQETAEIACQAAQTGHMVFSTVHANDTVTAIGRMIDLGVQPFLLANSLSAILSQRLVRVLCPKCKSRYKPNPEILRKANLPADKIKYFYKARTESEGGEDGGSTEDKCEFCGGTGYFGRTGVFELLVITDAMRVLIRENPNLTAVKQEAVKQGMRYLYEDGFRQVIEGRTSIQELMRVCK